MCVCVCVTENSVKLGNRCRDQTLESSGLKKKKKQPKNRWVAIRGGWGVISRANWKQTFSPVSPSVLAGLVTRFGRPRETDSKARPA